MYAYDYYDSSFLPRPAAPTGNLIIPWVSVQITSLTRAIIVLGSPTGTTGSYSGDVTSTGSFSFPDFSFTSTSGVYVKESLIPGKTYYIRARAWSGSGQTGSFGDWITDSFTMPSYNPFTGMTSTATTVLVPPNSTADAAGPQSSSKSSSQVTLNNSVVSNLLLLFSSLM